MPTLISILSDQLIPNVLFIRRMSNPGDVHVFISTREMEGRNKSAILAQTLGLENEDFRVLQIDPHDPELILQQLHASDLLLSDHQYIVNITGGTKMMSQMVTVFFNAIPQAQVCYWPGNRDPIYQIFPTVKSIPKEGALNIDLKSYLSAYGYSFIGSNVLTQPEARTETIFRQVTKRGGAEKVHSIVEAKSQSYTKPDKQYLLGGWFEEWLYTRMKERMNLKDDDIAYNVKLKSRFAVTITESDSEVDIAYVFQNKLYIWECKVYYSTLKSTGEKIRLAAHKLSSIRQTLGLQSVSHAALLVPLGNSPNRKASTGDLCHRLQIRHIWSLEDMRDPDSFLDAALSDDKEV
jgi:hypothetical protein